ncbi:unnamed protein product [Pararhodospirillum photometricum DSM 122]|uniref:Uncharacterized protein n=1 Tax=Pararhodospirillum photometricum DSM 122 TaxID=1150469 RepID=H6SJW0_PARPM|nr:unnamed protein product [Pararhodospirillum photometricum DSM 122]
MAVLVIDSFEMIDVDHQDGKGLALAPSAGDFVFQRMVQGDSVGKVGQAVGACEALQHPVALA